MSPARRKLLDEIVEQEFVVADAEEVFNGALDYLAVLNQRLDELEKDSVPDKATLLALYGAPRNWPYEAAS